MNEMEVDVVCVAPGVKLGGGELQAVIDPDPGRQLPTVFVFELFEHADDACCGQRSVHLDGEHFTSSFIKRIEGADVSSAAKSVLHEVHRPLVIDLGWGGQGLADPCRDAFLGASSREIELHGLINAPQALVIDASLLLSKPAMTFPNAREPASRALR